MGFLKTVTSSSGIEVADAYHRIDFLNGNQDNVDVFVTSYPSVEFYLSNKSAHPLTTNKYTFKPDVRDESPNLFRQSYAHLKTLDGYHDVVDVLEEGQEPL